MRFGSVCSGIEAASVAFEPLGWSAAWLAEIEPFPSAVLAHHYPDVPNLGNMTAIPRRLLAGEIEAPDMLCGGTPCQAFSVAGLRESLSDERGNLTLTFVEIADAIDHVRARRGAPPAIILWENVPGVLSTRDNAFGCFLAGLAGEDDSLEPPGGRWANAGAVYGPARAVAWRVLDAQYFQLAQRRRRVFVVASARDGFDPAAVLFEWDGVRRDSAPSREAGEGAAAGTLRSTDGGSDVDHARAGHLTVTCMAHGQGGAEIREDSAPTLTCNHEAPIAAYAQCVTGDITHTLKAEGFDASEDGTGRRQPIVAFDTTQITSATNRSNPQPGGPCHPLSAGAHPPAIAQVVGAMSASGSTERKHGLGWGQQDWENGYAQPHGAKVRRLTPRECERLQGFPDDWTLVPWRKKPAGECPDGPRYKALGNSWAVPCVRWIGRRIQRQTGRIHG